MEDLIIKKLINNIKETNKNKSSYWEEYLKEDLDFLNESEFLGFAGNYTKKSLKNIAHSLLIRIIYGNQIFKTETYSKYKSIYDKIDRFIDSDGCCCPPDRSPPRRWRKSLRIGNSSKISSGIRCSARGSRA